MKSNLYIILLVFLLSSKFCFSQFTPELDKVYKSTSKSKNGSFDNTLGVHLSFNPKIVINQLEKDFGKYELTREEREWDNQYLWKDIKNRKWSKNSLQIEIIAAGLNKSILNKNGQKVKDSNGKTKYSKLPLIFIKIMDNQHNNILDDTSTNWKVRRYFTKLIRRIKKNQSK